MKKIGGIGLITDTFRKATNFNRLIPGLFSSGKLINPVIGLNLFPNNSKLTIGWLDPSDYVGEINWVPLEKNKKIGSSTVCSRLMASLGVTVR